MDSGTAPHDLIAQVRERVRALESLEAGERDVSAVELIDEMESLKNAAAAAQARASHLLRQTRVAERAHLPAPMRERGVATEVALARRESPRRGAKSPSGFRSRAEAAARNFSSDGFKKFFVGYIYLFLGILTLSTRYFCGFSIYLLDKFRLMKFIHK